MSPNTSKREELVRRWFEDLFNGGEPSVADEILADDVAYHGPPSLSPRDVSGPDDVRSYVETYQAAFPDVWYTVEDVVAEGDAVRVHWVATGTHESDLFGIEPSGESFSVEGLSAFRVEDGAIAEVWAQWDTLKMARELDAVPPVGAATE